MEAALHITSRDPALERRRGALTPPLPDEAPMMGSAKVREDKKQTCDMINVFWEDWEWEVDV